MITLVVAGSRTPAPALPKLSAPSGFFPTSFSVKCCRRIEISKLMKGRTILTYNESRAESPEPLYVRGAKKSKAHCQIISFEAKRSSKHVLRRKDYEVLFITVSVIEIVSIVIYILPLTASIDFIDKNARCLNWEANISNWYSKLPYSSCVNTAAINKFILLLFDTYYRDQKFIIRHYA